MFRPTDFRSGWILALLIMSDKKLFAVMPKSIQDIRKSAKQKTRTKDRKIYADAIKRLAGN